MDAVTYPQESVIDFINENTVPLRVPSDAEPQAKDFNIKWTPTLITLGDDGREHHRTVGFLGPDEVIPSQLLGIAKYHFDNDRFKEALSCLEKVLDSFPKCDAAPEAIFLQGVCHYKDSKDPKPLKQAYETLAKAYPGSEWTKRAYPYRLL
jgi:tetratricopeptide (TPR) repeat protein